jgi:hypothetical protein
VGITGWEAARYGQRVSAGVALALGTMISGSVIAGQGDMTADAIGIGWMLANVVCNVSYLAAMKEWMPAGVSAGSKTLHNNVLTVVFFSATAASSGQLRAFCERLPLQTGTFQLGVLFSGIVGMFLNISTFWCLHVTTGATYSFVGASNRIPLVLLGHYFFHSVITPTGWCGVALGLSSGLVYAGAKECERQAKVQPQPEPADEEQNQEKHALVSAEADDEQRLSDAEADEQG